MAALFLLGGCQRKPAPVEAPRPFMLADAMTHWYGRYDPATQTAFDAEIEDLLARFQPTSPHELALIHVMATAEIREQQALALETEALNRSLAEHNGRFEDAADLRVGAGERSGGGGEV